MSLPHSFLSGKGGGPLTLFEVLIGFGATEVSSNVFRLTVPGSYNIDLQGLPVSVHVIGAGGTSGFDGMGYGNCGGGGGGPLLKAARPSLGGVASLLRAAPGWDGGGGGSSRASPKASHATRSA